MSVTPQKIRIYCDECEYLEEHNIYLDDGMVSGKRYYCPISKKYYPINSSMKEIGFSYCDKGKKAETKDCDNCKNAWTENCLCSTDGAECYEKLKSEKACRKYEEGDTE